MEALTTRHIRDGAEFDHLFPKAAGKTEMVKAYADLEDTLKLIPKVVRQYNWQAIKIAARLQGRTVRQTCRNIWDFCYNYIQYFRDAPGKEQIRTPARSWRDRKAGIDCDCYSVLISSILQHVKGEGGSLGISHKMRITSYPDPTGKDSNPPFQHIYVIVPTRTGHITIDPVTDRFDYEVPYHNKRDLPMELQVLNGHRGGAKAPPGSLGGVDYEDLFADNLEGIPTLPLSGHGPGDIQGQARQAFIQRHGMTPEQWAQSIREDLDEGDEPMGDLGRRRRRPRRQKKKKKKKRGGGLLNVVNKVNKFNPATALLRGGILLAMKINYFGIARKLRWGKKSFAEAKAANPRRMTKDKHNKLVKTYKSLLKTHLIAGGKEDTFEGAIFYGKGNKDKKARPPSTAKVPKRKRRNRGVRGLGDIHDPNITDSVLDILGADVIEDEGLQHLSGLGSLGAVSAAALIGAATTVLGAIAAILKSVGKVEDDPNGQAATNPAIDKITKIANTATTVANTIDTIRNGEPSSAQGGGAGDAVTFDIETADGSSTANSIEQRGGDTAVQPAEDGTGTGTNNKKAPDEPGFFEKHKKPLMWGGIGLAALGLAFVGYKALSKPKAAQNPAVAGIDRLSVTGKKIPEMPTLPKGKKSTASSKRKAPAKRKTTTTRSGKKTQTVQGIPVP